MAVSANISRIVKDEIARFNKDEQQRKTAKEKIFRIGDPSEELFIRIRNSLVKQGAATAEDFKKGFLGFGGSETYDYVIQEIAKNSPLKGKLDYMRSLASSSTGERNYNSALPKELKGKVDLNQFHDDLQTARKEQYQQRTDMSLAGKAASTVVELVSNPIEAVSGGGIAGKMMKGAKSVITPVTGTVAAKTTMPSVVKYTPNALGKMVSKVGIIPEKASKALRAAGTLLGTSLVVTLASCGQQEKIEGKTITIPAWMPKKFGIEAYSTTDTETLKKALKNAEHNAEYFKKAADNVEKTGHNLVIGSRKFTPAELRQRAIEYSLFEKDLRKAIALPSGVSSAKIKSASDKELEGYLKNAEAKMNTYVSMAKEIGTKNKEGKMISAVKGPDGSAYSLYDIDIRMSQYRNYIIELDKEQDRRIQQHIAQEKTQQQSYAASQAASSSPQEQVQQSESGQETPMQQPLQQMQDGWGRFFQNSGLSDFVKYPGLSLAMLPEMLFGMLKDDNENSFGLNKSTMMPLAAIMGSMFISNPLLKILLLTGGGMGLLSKTAKEVSPERSAAKQYKAYPDEQLNDRVSNVTINGNTVIMDIDGVPRSIVIPEKAAEAYQTGALSQNTLANAILKKYDEQSQQMAQNFEKEKTPTVGIGIK